MRKAGSVPGSLQAGGTHMVPGTRWVFVKCMKERTNKQRNEWRVNYKDRFWDAFKKCLISAWLCDHDNSTVIAAISEGDFNMHILKGKDQHLVNCLDLNTVLIYHFSNPGMCDEFWSLRRRVMRACHLGSLSYCLLPPSPRELFPSYP